MEKWCVFDYNIEWENKCVCAGWCELCCVNVIYTKYKYYKMLCGPRKECKFDEYYMDLRSSYHIIATRPQWQMIDFTVIFKRSRKSRIQEYSLNLSIKIIDIFDHKVLSIGCR